MNIPEDTQTHGLSPRTLMRGRQAEHVSARADYVRQRLAELTSEQGADGASAKVVIAAELETTPRQVRLLLAKPRKADAATVFATVAKANGLHPSALSGAARHTAVKNAAAYAAYMKGCTLRAIAIQLGGVTESAALRRVRLHEKTLK